MATPCAPGVQRASSLSARTRLRKVTPLIPQANDGHQERYHALMTIAQVVPDVDVLLALEPEELGAKLLFLVRTRLRFDGDMFFPANFENEI